MVRAQFRSVTLVQGHSRSYKFRCVFFAHKFYGEEIEEGASSLMVSLCSAGQNASIYMHFDAEYMVVAPSTTVLCIASRTSI